MEFTPSITTRNKSACFSIFSVLLHVLLLVSCNHRGNQHLISALELAGANRTELETVLSHYAADSKDSLKLRATEFLIANMPYHFSLEEYYLSPGGNKHRPDISLFDDAEGVSLYCDARISRCRHRYYSFIRRD